MMIFKKKPNKIATTRLTRFDIEFKTVDGEIHIFDRITPVDENSIKDNKLDYFLSDKIRLEDSDGVYYPMSNIISIKAVNVRYIDNVKKITYGEYDKIWYGVDDIDIVADKKYMDGLLISDKYYSCIKK